MARGASGSFLRMERSACLLCLISNGDGDSSAKVLSTATLCVNTMMGDELYSTVSTSGGWICDCCSLSVIRSLDVYTSEASLLGVSDSDSSGSSDRNVARLRLLSAQVPMGLARSVDRKSGV